MITKAIIPVAGIGSRFLPASKSIPKVLFPIVDKPVIHYIVEDAVKSGIKEIIFVTSKNNHRAVKEYFSPNAELKKILEKKGRLRFTASIDELIKKARFYYVNQPKPLGDGEAVLRGAKYLKKGEAAVVMWGDDVIIDKRPTVRQLIKVYKKYKSPVFLVEEIKGKAIEHYGVMDGTKVEKNVYKVNRIVEKPKLKQAPSKLAVVGNYIITSDILNRLKNQNPGKRGEIGLSIALDNAIAGGDVYAYKMSGTWHDCGSKVGWLRANVELGKQDLLIGKEVREFLKNN